MSDTRTLGQIARHAFVQATGPTGEDDWEAAARAVAEVVYRHCEAIAVEYGELFPEYMRMAGNIAERIANARPNALQAEGGK